MTLTNICHIAKYSNEQVYLEKLYTMFKKTDAMDTILLMFVVKHKMFQILGLRMLTINTPTFELRLLRKV